jgi:CBS domain-containing protein
MSAPVQFTITIAATLLDAAARIEANHSRSVIVLADDVVEGVISEGDILRALLRGADIRAPLRDFVHHDFKYLRSPDYPQALELAKRFGISLIPVVDEKMRLKEVLPLSKILERVRL